MTLLNYVGSVVLPPIPSGRQNIVPIECVLGECYMQMQFLIILARNCSIARNRTLQWEK